MKRRTTEAYVPDMALREYLTSEVTADFSDGLLTRREALRRLVLLGVTATSAGALLAACGGSDDDEGGDGGGGAPADGTTTPTTPTTEGSTTSTTASTPVGAANLTFDGPKGVLQAAFAAATTACVVGADHAFNDTGARYDESAAEEAQAAVLAWFERHLG